MARDLIADQSLGMGLLVGGLSAMVLGLLIGVASGDDDTLLWSSVGGVTIGSTAALSSIFVFPSRREIYEVVNAWNRRRPGRPIEWKEAPQVYMYRSSEPMPNFRR